MNKSLHLDFCVPLEPRTKKNAQNIYKNPRTGTYFISPSEKFKQYQKDCQWFMPKLKEPIDFPINLKCIFYRSSKRRVDLVNLQEAICDILTHYGVLKDDNRNIIATMDGSMVLYDKESPRTEIEITQLDNYEQW